MNRDGAHRTSSSRAPCASVGRTDADHGADHPAADAATCQGGHAAASAAWAAAHGSLRSAGWACSWSACRFCGSSWSAWWMMSIKAGPFDENARALILRAFLMAETEQPKPLTDVERRVKDVINDLVGDRVSATDKVRLRKAVDAAEAPLTGRAAGDHALGRISRKG